MKKFTLLSIMAILCLSSYGNVGDTFTVKTANDVDMAFTVTAEGNVNTVMTGQRYSAGKCIDWNYTGDVIVPVSVQYNGKKYNVTTIGANSFNGCYMKSLQLPSTLQKIEVGAIYATRYLTSLTIPASVISIEEGAIAQNPLTSLVVEKENKYYVSEGNVVFNKDKTLLLQYACDLPAATYAIPNTVKKIGYNAMDNCDNLVEVIIPNSVEEIGGDAFHQCSKLSKVNIPASVLKIGEGAFTGYNYALKSIDVDKNNPNYTSVNGVLYTKDMKTIVCYPVAKDWGNYEISDGTNSIYGGAFNAANNLYGIKIPTSVSYIGRCAFFSCRNLQSVDIPKTVTYIGSQAFDYCYNLTKVYFHSVTPPETGGNAIFGGNKDLKIYVPYNSIKKYKENRALTAIHLDPAIDWHDNHWYFTFCCVVGVNFTKSTGLTAYKIIANPYYKGNQSKQHIGISTRAANSDSPIVMVQVDKAGPGDCVLLHAEPGYTYELASDETAPNIQDNLLVGATEDSSVWGTEGDNANFAFDGDSFVGVVGTENVVGGTGYLKLPKSIIPTEMSRISVESIPTVTTGISSPWTINDHKQSLHFGLDGVKNNSNRKGVHIVDGKKIIFM